MCNVSVMGFNVVRSVIEHRVGGAVGVEDIAVVGAENVDVVFDRPPAVANEMTLPFHRCVEGERTRAAPPPIAVDADRAGIGRDAWRVVMTLSRRRAW